MESINTVFSFHKKTYIVMMIQSKFGRKSKVAEKSNEDSLNTRRRMNKNVKESKSKKNIILVC